MHTHYETPELIVSTIIKNAAARKSRRQQIVAVLLAFLIGGILGAGLYAQILTLS